MCQCRDHSDAGTVTSIVVQPQSLEGLSAEQLRSALLSMLQAAAAKDQELALKQTLIDKLTHEKAPLKRMKFAAQSHLAFLALLLKRF